jgi:hypothetical protein
MLWFECFPSSSITSACCGVSTCQRACPVLVCIALKVPPVLRLHTRSPLLLLLVHFWCTFCQGQLLTDNIGLDIGLQS